MRIFIASVNLGDKPEPHRPAHRLLSFWEIRQKLFGADQVFMKLKRRTP